MKKLKGILKWKCLDCNFKADIYADILLHQKITGHRVEAERVDRRITGISIQGSDGKPIRLVKAR